MKEKDYYSFEPFFSKLMGTCEIYTFCSVGCSDLIGGRGGGTWRCYFSLRPPACSQWFYLCAAVWLHLHDSVSPRIHLPPLSSHPSASLLSYAPPPCWQTQCQHDVGLAQCVGLMGKEKSLNMQKGLFNPHFFDSFFVVQHYQLNPLILGMSFSVQNK